MIPRPDRAEGVPGCTTLQENAMEEEGRKVEEMKRKGEERKKEVKEIGKER